MTGPGAQEPILEGQVSTAHPRNPSVHPLAVGLNRPEGVGQGVGGGELAFNHPAKTQPPRLPIDRQGSGPEQLSKGARRRPGLELELEQPIPGHQIPESPIGIEFLVGIDVRNAPGVDNGGDRALENREPDGFGDTDLGGPRYGPDSLTGVEEWAHRRHQPEGPGGEQQGGHQQPETGGAHQNSFGHGVGNFRSAASLSSAQGATCENRVGSS